MSYLNDKTEKELLEIIAKNSIESNKYIERIHKNVLFFFWLILSNIIIISFYLFFSYRP